MRIVDITSLEHARRLLESDSSKSSYPRWAREILSGVNIYFAAEPEEIAILLDEVPPKLIPHLIKALHRSGFKAAFHMKGELVIFD